MTLDELFEMIPTANNHFFQFLSNYRNTGKKIFLFGAGFCGHVFLRLMEQFDLDIEGIIDNYSDSLDGHPVQKLAEVLQKYNVDDCIFIISAFRPLEEILDQLLKVCKEEQIFVFAMTRYGVPENLPEPTKEYLLSHRDEIEEVYNLLADQQSKDVLLHMLLGHVTASYGEYESIWTGDAYYAPELITFHENEVMVELGSNNGDTLLDFIRRCPDFKKSYCFEPDDICVKELHKIIQPYKSRIVIIPKVAWNGEGWVSFASENGNGSSRVDEQKGDVRLETASVDGVVEEDITYMKMDIEGAEMMALQGAKEQIKRNKPRLAICVYHKNEDIVDIPRYILSLRPDYRLYLRHEGRDDTDTVLYAI